MTGVEMIDYENLYPSTIAFVAVFMSEDRIQPVTRYQQITKLLQFLY
jgi:hypothetical protein